MTAKNPHGQFEWKRRRRIIYATLIYCAVSTAAIQTAALFGVDTELLRTLAWNNFGLSGSVIGAYVFGAMWDDMNARKHFRRGDDSSDDSTDDPGAPAE